MKQKRHRKHRQMNQKWHRKHRQGSDPIPRILESVETALRMAEEGLRPMPLELEDPLDPGTFTGETSEMSWHFADHLLLLSIGIESSGTRPRFDILVNNYELATALVEIPIISHLNLRVTPVDMLPSDDSRYDDAPCDVPLWRAHSPDFQECHPDELYVMHLLTEEEMENVKQ